MKSVTEIIEFMTHSSLDMYKKRNSKAPVALQHKAHKTNLYNNGAVFVSRSKELLSNGQGYVITSYETINEQYNGVTHWTPNTYRYGTYKDKNRRYIKGHLESNLKQVNVLGFDIDSKDPSILYGIFLGCDELELPRPNLILETTNGYQGFFILESPFYIRKDNNQKALHTAKRVSDNIRKSLNKYVPIDMGCSHFGFYRIPNDRNILFFDEMPIKSEQLVSWSRKYQESENKPLLYVVPGNHTGSQTSSEWYQQLISNPNITSGIQDSGRNNALFTMALANYGDGRSIELAYDELDQFNSNLVHPLSKNDFEKVIQSAYSGKYQGPKEDFVNYLMKNWGQGATYQAFNNGWYKFKKKRKDRIRSHYEEWESDIEKYIHSKTTKNSPFLEGSQSKLAGELGMPLSTFKEVLKRSKKLFKVSKGRGRSAITYLTTQSMLLKHYLNLKQLKQMNNELFRKKISDKTYLTIYDFPVLEEVINEFAVLIRSGTSPPEVVLSG